MRPEHGLEHGKDGVDSDTYLCEPLVGNAAKCSDLAEQLVQRSPPVLAPRGRGIAAASPRLAGLEHARLLEQLRRELEQLEQVQREVRGDLRDQDALATGANDATRVLDAQLLT